MSSLYVVSSDPSLNSTRQSRKELRLVPGSNLAGSNLEMSLFTHLDCTVERNRVAAKKSTKILH